MKKQIILSATIASLILLVNKDMLAQHINIIEHDNIRSAMNKYINYNQSNASINGWRIQIVSTDDRRKMEAAKAKFENMYPGLYINWEHRSPWYLVKVGAYKTKLEVQAALQELKGDFAQAIPINDNVRKTELLR